jgi:hypothetical protein
MYSLFAMHCHWRLYRWCSHRKTKTRSFQHVRFQKRMRFHRNYKPNIEYNFLILTILFPWALLCRGSLSIMGDWVHTAHVLWCGCVWGCHVDPDSSLSQFCQFELLLSTKLVPMTDLHTKQSPQHLLVKLCRRLDSIKFIHIKKSAPGHKNSWSQHIIEPVFRTKLFKKGCWWSPHGGSDRCVAEQRWAFWFCVSQFLLCRWCPGSSPLMQVGQ